MCSVIWLQQLYFTKGVKNKFCIQNLSVRSQGCFVGKIGRGDHSLSKIFNFPKKELYAILSS